MTSCHECMIHIQNPVYYCKFRHVQAYSRLLRHIQPYCGIFKTLRNSCIFRTLPYSETWHIQNTRYIHNSLKLCSGIFRTLCNARILTPCHVQNFAIFRILAYLGPEAYSEYCLFKHIQAYSIMIVVITLTFFFSL